MELIPIGKFTVVTFEVLFYSEAGDSRFLRNVEKYCHV
jgi:hypothetical protein